MRKASATARLLLLGMVEGDEHVEDRPEHAAEGALEQDGEDLSLSHDGPSRGRSR
jgi:hypothetical protein